ncbi:Hypothetical_protein [Hexamita inflata]|uniref:Hypothetical_protein n=1 Tax=Hexamita inflata TaxID=28002 RepID=A0ABP1GEG2_9EUKA
MTPLSIYNKPVLPRTLAYLGISLLSVGIALIVIFSTNQDQLGSPGLMVGGLICLFFGTVLGMISLVSCCIVQSFTYIMMPCCMGEAARKQLEEQATARTQSLSVMGMMPAVMNEQLTQMLNGQQQIGGYQYVQVQPMMVVQNQTQGIPQELENQNQQQNIAQPFIPAPMQAPTVPVQIELALAPFM